MQDEYNLLLDTVDFMQQQYIGYEEPEAQHASTLFCDVCGSDSVQVSLCGELDEEYTCVCNECSAKWISGNVWCA